MASGLSGFAIATTSPANSLKGLKHSGLMRKRRVALYSPSPGACSATVNALDDMDAIAARVVGDRGRKEMWAPKTVTQPTGSATLHPESCYDLVKPKDSRH